MKKFEVLGNEWKTVLQNVMVSQDFLKLQEYILNEYTIKKIFPEQKKIFRAFDITPFSNVRVVVLGQDPYHDEQQANGLSFSVNDNVKLPPSLKNIYKEIESDLGISKDFSNGNLENWATQGVLLLNSVLTVVAHTPSSHKGKGWEVFTDSVIKEISDKRSGVVFMLWGKYAKSKMHLMDTSKHLVLEATHPSPFSAYSGFFGCKHFSKCNEYLKKQGGKPIKW